MNSPFTRPDETRLEALMVNDREVARLTGLCTRTIATLKAEGKLPYVRIGRAVRFPLEGVKAWIATNTRKGAE